MGPSFIQVDFRRRAIQEKQRGREGRSRVSASGNICVEMAPLKMV